MDKFLSTFIVAFTVFWSVVIFILLLTFTTIVPVVYLVEYFLK